MHPLPGSHIVGVAVEPYRPRAGTLHTAYPPYHQVQYGVPALPGDLPKLSFGTERLKNVEVVGGGEELLKSCLTDSTTWSKDPLMFRLAHSHATEIQSCRENEFPRNARDLPEAA